MTMNRREFLASLAGGIGALCVHGGSASSAATGGYALAGTVMTGDGPPLADHAVLFKSGVIEAIVPAGTVTNRPVIAPPDATIIPGVINAHCHTIHTAADRRSRWLEHGVTAIGDVASSLAAMRQLADSPTGATATAAFSGPMLTPPGGYPTPVYDHSLSLAVASPAKATDAVRMLADLGASFIKISFEPGVAPEPWPVFDTATAAAICDTARALGLTVRCHVEDFSGLEPALDAGVHTIEHVPHRWNRNGSMQPVLTDGELIPEYLKLLERMVRDHVILTPTLDVLTRSPWNGPALFEPVRAFHAMGGQIALGNDYPFRRTDTGMPIREMRLLSKAGLDGRAVLRAATRTSAQACGFANRGTLAPGMAADMMVVSGDPTEDFTALAEPLLIAKDGIFVE